MFFGFFIFTRILFVACMVFVFGYIFGPFSKNKTLSVMARIATVLVVVLFISTNVLLFRYGRNNHNRWNNAPCHTGQVDTVSLGKKA